MIDPLRAFGAGLFCFTFYLHNGKISKKKIFVQKNNVSKIKG